MRASETSNKSVYISLTLTPHYEGHAISLTQTLFLCWSVFDWFAAAVSPLRVAVLSRTRGPRLFVFYSSDRQN